MFLFCLYFVLLVLYKFEFDIFGVFIDFLIIYFIKINIIRLFEGIIFYIYGFENNCMGLNLKLFSL